MSESKEDQDLIDEVIDLDPDEDTEDDVASIINTD